MEANLMQNVFLDVEASKWKLDEVVDFDSMRSVPPKTLQMQAQHLKKNQQKTGEFSLR